MKVSVVTSIFNGRAYLPAFFDSLAGALPDGSQLILVDDGSVEPVFDTVPEFARASEVLKLRNEQNVGYAAAVNRGCAEATGDLVVQLNTDLVLQPQTIHEMIQLVGRTSSVGVVGSKLIYPTTGLLQHIGIGFGNHTSTHVYYGLPADHPLCSRDRQVQATSAAAAAMTTRVLRKLGPLDERYFNCHEDLDYCMRAGAAGLRNYVCASSVAYHWESLSGPTRFARTRSSMATFWSKWGQTYRPDLGNYVGESLDHLLGINSMLESARFQLLNLSRGVDDAIAVAELDSRWPGVAATERNFRQTANPASSLRMPLLVPHWMLTEPTPYVYLVDRYRELQDNAYWFDTRRQIVSEELIVDLSGIAMLTSELHQ